MDPSHTSQPQILWRDESSSTNADLRALVEAADSPIPHGTMLVTANQTRGRGRLDRGWETPPGQALATSVLVRGFGQQLQQIGSAPGTRRSSGRVTTPSDSGEPGLAPSWLPLLTGSAITETLQPLFNRAANAATETAAPADEAETRSPLRVGVKWPNDVHVRDEEDAVAGRPGLKLCGILCELLPDGSMIVGAGINVLIPEWELPTERATSLLAAGADVDGAQSLDDGVGRAFAERILTTYRDALLALVQRAVTDPAVARSRVLRHSLTLGHEVRVHLPGGEIVDGRAVGLSEDGSLEVDLPTGGKLTVSAGDVEHLR